MWYFDSDNKQYRTNLNHNQILPTFSSFTLINEKDWVVVNDSTHNLFHLGKIDFIYPEKLHESQDTLKIVRKQVKWTITESYRDYPEIKEILQGGSPFRRLSVEEMNQIVDRD